jgi:hypothetical protein
MNEQGTQPKCLFNVEVPSLVVAGPKQWLASPFQLAGQARLVEDKDLPA